MFRKAGTEKKRKRGEITALKIEKIQELRSKYNWTLKEIGG